MSRNFLSRVVLAIAVASAAAVPMSGTSFAAQSTGKIITYHLNGNVAGRGVCVKTTPALPTGGWGCVWYSDHLYREYTDLLREAYLAGKTCVIAWNETDPNGFALISVVECD